MNSEGTHVVEPCDCGKSAPATPEPSETKCPHCSGIENWDCCNCATSCGPDCPGDPPTFTPATADTVPRVDYECAMELARGRVPREEYEALRDALIEASDHLHESYSKAMSRGCTDFDPCPVDIRSESALRHADEVLGRKP